MKTKTTDLIIRNQWHHFMNGNGNDEVNLNYPLCQQTIHITYDDQVSVSRNSAFAVKTSFYFTLLFVVFDRVAEIKISLKIVSV